MSQDTQELTVNGYEPWSPDQIRETMFGTGSRRNPGFDESEVDQFKTRVADEIAWLHGVIRDLKAQLGTTTVFEVSDTGELTAYGNVDEQALQIRIAAQEEADRVIREATSQADDIVADANEQADQIVSDAAEQARSIVETAQATSNDAANESGLPERVPVDRIAETLPQRLDEFERMGTSITDDVERLETAAAAARTRLEAQTDSIRRTLLSGARRTQPAPADDMPDDANLTDPPG